MLTPAEMLVKLVAWMMKPAFDRLFPVDYDHVPKPITVREPAQNPHD